MLHCTIRIVPNHSGWQQPVAGRLNSRKFTGYAQKHGFGHDDWNFNKDFHYAGFLYGHLKYNPAELIRGSAFNLAILDFRDDECFLVGFYLETEFVPSGAPKRISILRQKAADLARLAKANELGCEWEGKSESQLLRLIDDGRWCLQWRVRAENAVLLQTPIALSTNGGVNEGISNKHFSTPTFVSENTFDALWHLSTIQSCKPTDTDLESPEGAVSLHLHRVRERDPKLVKMAKKLFRARHGRLFCEICEFDFGHRYGEDIGADYIEAHHTAPVSTLSPNSKTKVSDLGMVCSNCHRMLHKANPIITMGDLRKRLQHSSKPTSR